MKTVSIIFPHQLFKNSPLLKKEVPIYLVEEFLFFKQLKFHKQKIAFHRATLKKYEQYLISLGYEVKYIESTHKLSDIRILIPKLKELGVQQINYIDTVDNWLEKRILKYSKTATITLQQFNNDLFLNTPEELSSFFKKEKKKFHQSTFYTQERKKRNILVDENQKPVGGKWSFDAENRKKYPAKKTPPSIHFPDTDPYHLESLEYVEKHFSDHYGNCTKNKMYPTSFKETEQWLLQFLENRFYEFGTYEDAIVAENIILNHSVLTPMLNIGLITPKEVIEKTLKYSQENDIPINSVEGFIRQIIGWREFIRGMYITKGTEERTCNFWKFDKKIPQSFYNGTTGILPVDDTIKKVLETGYCHHIERLMILGNFMLLCEFSPDEVYQWFMELFMDAYDWVMVPNIYGMSQFADGGLMATKPYISGSNYILKMSNYKKGDWQQSWDGLFWNFMDKHRNFFSKNPRLNMLVAMFDKMPVEKKEQHLNNANDYLLKLKKVEH